jgi:hypothetical protein
LARTTYLPRSRDRSPTRGLGSWQHLSHGGRSSGDLRPVDAGGWGIVLVKNRRADALGPSWTSSDPNPDAVSRWASGTTRFQISQERDKSENCGQRPCRDRTAELCSGSQASKCTGGISPGWPRTMSAVLEREPIPVGSKPDFITTSKWRRIVQVWLGDFFGMRTFCVLGDLGMLGMTRAFGCWRFARWG